MVGRKTRRAPMVCEVRRLSHGGFEPRRECDFAWVVSPVTRRNPSGRLKTGAG
jgi:hypothetical protein